MLVGLQLSRPSQSWRRYGDTSKGFCLCRDFEYKIPGLGFSERRRKKTRHLNERSDDRRDFILSDGEKILESKARDFVSGFHNFECPEEASADKDLHLLPTSGIVPLVVFCIRCGYIKRSKLAIRRRAGNEDSHLSQGSQHKSL